MYHISTLLNLLRYIFRLFYRVTYLSHISLYQMLLRYSIK